jgi:hypothetical protein
MLDEPDLAVRVRAELLRVVVQRRLCASDHTVHVPRMGRMMKDLDRDIVPPPFMHRVGRGEERVVIPDRNIGRVVKVAACALRPRPAQPPRCDGHLTFVRANNRLERDPGGSSRLAPRFYVVEHRRLGARGQSIRSAIAGASQFAVRLVADGGQPRFIREVRAVGDDRGIHPAKIAPLSLLYQNRVLPEIPSFI